MSAFKTLIEKIRSEATSERAKRGAFYKLVAIWLTQDPVMKERFFKVWIWSDWPGRNGRPDTGIKNDPNDWCRENNQPEYIFNLILSLITLSVETIKIIKSLPKLGV